MNYRRFYFNTTLRTLLIGATAYLLVWSLKQDYMPATSISISLLGLLQVYLLVRYQGKFLSDITRFFEALESRDVSPSFTSQNPDLKPLLSHMERLMLHFRLVRREKEEERLLREVALEQAGVGIIILSKKGKVTFANSESKKLIGVYTTSNISDLPKALKEFTENFDDQRKQLITITNANGNRNISVRKTTFVIEGKPQTLLSLHDIQAEVEQTETEAWQKLIRVLTHEMVNSVKPISMLSSSLLDTWNSKSQISNQIQATTEELSELTEALKAINSRSESLNRFIQNFRNLTLPNRPEFKEVKLAQLLQQVEILFAPSMAKHKAVFSWHIEPEDLTVKADPKLLEQLLIILINNALEAPHNGREKSISIRANLIEHKAQLVVADNGDGIPLEVMEQMFTPFFTTKPNGSGVGLSLARQIMKLHHGTITTESNAGETKIVVTM